MVRWQDVNKKLVAGLGTAGGISVIGLFTALFMLTGIEYTHTGDITCGETCTVQVNVTTSYWRVCFEHPEPEQRIYIEGDGKLMKSTIGEYPNTTLYKKSTYGRTLWVNLNNINGVINTKPQIGVEWHVPTYGGKTRPLRDGDCWDRKELNKNYLIFHKKDYQTVKWSFELGDRIDIDPFLYGTASWAMYQTIDDSNRSGNTYYDSVGSNDAYHPNIAANISGKIGHAMNCTGETIYLRIDDDHTLDFTEAMTMSAWVKPSNDTKSQYIISKYDVLSSPDYSYIMILDVNTGNPRCYFSTGGGAGNLDSVVANISVEIDEWYFIACTYNSSDAAMKIYINGQLNGSDIHSVGGELSNTTAKVWIGSYLDNQPDRFLGKIDEINLWSTNLSQEAIQDAYERGLIGLRLDEDMVLSLSNIRKDISVELGSPITVFAAIFNDTICVDINHTDYGANYSCATNSTEFELDIDSFRKDSLETVEYGYQETANETSTYGGLASGKYNDSGYYLYINYSKPISSVGADWLVKHGNSTQDDPYNVTIPDACWNQDSKLVELRFYSNWSCNSKAYSKGQCYNGTDWITITNSYGDLDSNLCGASGSANSINLYDGDWGTYSTYIFANPPNYWRWATGFTNSEAFVYEEAMFWDYNTTSDVSTKFNLTFHGSQNKTTFLSAHQYDEVVNLTLNLTGFEYTGSFPDDVKIYVNGTLSNTIGSLSTELTVFNDSSSAKNATFTDADTQIIGYIRLPKDTTVTEANFIITGYNNTYIQTNGDNKSFNLGVTGTLNRFEVDYERKNRTFMAWEVKHGDSSDTRYNITSLGSCLNSNEDWLELGVYAGYSGGQGYSRPQCYDSGWNDLGSSQTTSVSVASGAISYVGIIDNNWDTCSCWCGGHGGCSDQWYADSSCNPSGSPNDVSAIYDEQVWWSSYPKDAWLEVGTLNGTKNWNYTPQYTGLNITDDFAARINDYLSGCSEDVDGFCYVPVNLYSSIGGILQISSISINYSVDVINPIVINSGIVTAFLSNSSGEVQIPLMFESSQAGILQIDDIKYDYRGGNQTYRVIAHNSTNTSTIEYDITYYYSDWTYSFPANVEYIEFIPIKGPTQKNVTPFGQTSTRPILNFTSQAYGGRNIDFTIGLNETFSCINDTISLNNSKSVGVQLTATFQNFTDNVDYEDSFDLYAWADFECTYSTWYLWNPYWYFRACCRGCDICEDDVENILEM